ncbi:MAG: DUF3443 family protein [Rhodoferax sp.]
MTVDLERAADATGSAGLARLVRVGTLFLLAGVLTACGGGGTSGTGGATASVAAAVGDANVVPVYADGGVALALGYTLPNAIYADVMICAPGSTDNCAVIPHLLVDTGSVGLRVLASALNAANSSLLAALPQTSTAAGSVVGECLPFTSGTTWGGVRSADLHWGGTGYGGTTVANLPLQVIGDADPRVAAVPVACLNQGAPMQTAVKLAANGILGIGLFAQDCGAYCAQSTSTPAPIYYACTNAGSCNAISMPTARQIQNPVAAAATDNNGTMISLPSGAAAQASGLLVLGIGSRANNGLAGASTILATDAVGHFTASFNGNTLPKSFLDSGSTANFMPTSGTVNLPECTSTLLAGTGYLCPGSSMTLVATNTGQSSTSGTANVLVIDANSAISAQPGYNVLPGLAADGGSVAANPTLDLGASFFFGRTITTLIENHSAPGIPVTGPALGYTP